MSKFSLLILSLCIAVTNGCSQKNDKVPRITDIKTSTKVLAKSDCIPTSARITANITGNTGIKSAALWYRIGQDQKFTSAPMKREAGDTYGATLIALNIPGGEYGTLKALCAVRGDSWSRDLVNCCSITEPNRGLIEVGKERAIHICRACDAETSILLTFVQ